MFEIVRTKTESDRINDFVAIGNLLDENFESFHCAFVIQYGKKYYEFHYTSKSVDFNPLPDRRDYFHKITETIHPEEVPAFIARCLNIQKNANPDYGYFYSGESYDVDGNHLSDSDLGERMTCVGFCLNVLKGFLEEDYLQFNDWDSSTHEDDGWLEGYCDENDIDINDVKAAHRRITPRECLASCFFSKLPISKNRIDEKLVEVDSHFNNRQSNP